MPLALRPIALLLLVCALLCGCDADRHDERHEERRREEVVSEQPQVVVVRLGKPQLLVRCDDHRRLAGREHDFETSVSPPVRFIDAPAEREQRYYVFVLFPRLYKAVR